MCHYNQQCVNTVGTYRCQAKCGPGFKPSITGTSCEGKSLLITVKLSAQQFIWRQNNSIPELLSTFFRPVTAVFNQDSFLSVQYTGCPQWIDSVICVFQMWTSAKSLLSPRVSISVSILWAPSAVSATPGTSCQDTAASVSHVTRWDSHGVKQRGWCGLSEVLCEVPKSDRKNSTDAKRCTAVDRGNISISVYAILRIFSLI